MSDYITPIDSPAETQIPSTQGMTTKVVKGSLWTLAGTILPFAVTFFATPFIIRLLGSEGYGVLILIGLIPNYFIFADFGMGVASTKFGSEAYVQGLKEKEGKVVRTAALIAFACSLPVTLVLFFFSPLVVSILKIPEHWHSQASVGLKITSLVFIISILAGIFNTPQLSRLRMDLNTLVNTVSKILLPAGTIVVLSLGGGIIGAAWVSLFGVITGLAGHLFFSGRLLPQLFQPKIDRELVRPMIKYGVGLMFASMAVTTLVNLEKLALTGLISVQSLAFYSVAFTFANMATMFSGSMIQSLVPAFSQLLEPEKKQQFESLYSRSLRLNLIWLFPAIMFLFVIARPFFTIWAGEEFGRASSLPFYLLLPGLFFQIMAYIPYSTITAFGRTDLLAKLYWIEIFIFIPVTIFFVSSFGIEGAAVAWSLRASFDALSIIWLAKRATKVSVGFLGYSGVLIVAIVPLLFPILFVILVDNFSKWLIGVVIISLIFYSIFIWKWFITSEEKIWIESSIRGLLGLKPA